MIKGNFKVQFIHSNQIIGFNRNIIYHKQSKSMYIHVQIDRGTYKHSHGKKIVKMDVRTCNRIHILCNMALISCKINLVTQMHLNRNLRLTGGIYTYRRFTAEFKPCILVYKSIKKRLKSRERILIGRYHSVYFGLSFDRYR